MSKKTYIVFPIKDLNFVNFSEVMETSPNTMRFSLAEDLTFVKTNSELPSFLELLSEYQLYSESEFRDIVNSYPWAIPRPYPDGSVLAGNSNYVWNQNSNDWELTENGKI